ncbi:heparinase II/III-family protein [Burkholderia sp. AU33545]|uniref:heparinase II/III domain-containing protein n=1 Tax=Burkholderia sp. AU33545 TaxID=2879631 RepID=UPI001CF386EF|nr:heparinase II/III family protein [Burkholderia sp. AU33545]MCA8199653.1 heparinase II/III-family protein [Burkholderia sp. AU33545]
MIYCTASVAEKTSVELCATILGGLPDGTNLILLINGDALTEQRATEIGFVPTKGGYYQYLKPSVQDERLCHAFDILPEVTSVNIRLWGIGAQPVVLDDVRVTGVEAGGFRFLSARPRRIVRKWDPLAVQQQRPIAANLLLAKHACGAACVVHCNKWLDSMDGYEQRTKRFEFGRDDVYVERDTGELILASVQRARPAMLEIPESIDAYWSDIGDKSRNMVRKARRLGYEFRAIDPDEYGQDIYEIRTSDPMRQGRPIPEYYYKNPPEHVLKPSSVGCRLHTERFYGVFKDDRLVAYVTLFLFGELAQVNHLLCHRDHASSGAMNLNVFHVVDELIRHQPEVRVLNYLYIGQSQGGINHFKESVGFRDTAFMTYDSVVELYERHRRNRLTIDGSTAPSVPSFKTKVKDDNWTFMREQVSGDVMQAIESRIGRRVARLPMPVYQEFERYLSRGLSETVIDWMEGSCFAVPFPDQIPDIDDGLCNYMRRRFKRSPISNDGFETAFKGSDFRVLGYFQVSDDDALFFRGLLVVEKLTPVGVSNVRGLTETFQKFGKAGLRPDLIVRNKSQGIFVTRDRFMASVPTEDAALDRVCLADEYQPLGDGWLLGNIVKMSFPYSTATVDIELNKTFAWNSELPNNSVRMWYYSLIYIGRLLATYHKTNDSASLDLALSLTSDYLDYVAVAEHRAGVDNIASADHATAERLKVMLTLHQIVRKSKYPRGVALLPRLLEEMHYCAEWLTEEANLGVGNHQLMGCMSLMFTYSLLSNEAGAVYLETALRRVRALLEESFDKDGLCNENTIGYHNFNLSLYTKIHDALGRLGVAASMRSDIEPVLGNAMRALQLAIFPNGKIPPIGDSPRYDSHVSSVNESFCFFESGFAVVKRDDFYMSLICGGRTNWHKHMDDTAIYLQYRGEDVFIDGGSYSYDQRNPHTRCITSSAGHSGVFLSQFDGLPRYELIAKYGPVSGSIKRFEESDDGVRIECAYSVPGCWTSFRRFVFVHWIGEVVIVDMVRSPNLAAAVQRFLLAPNISAHAEQGIIRLQGETFDGAIIHSSQDADFYRGEQDAKVRGWSTYDFGEISPTTGIDLSGGSIAGELSSIVVLNGTDPDGCSAAARAFANKSDPFFTN